MSQFKTDHNMEQLDLNHPAITQKILHSIFIKTTRLSAIRLAQTGRLGRDTFNSTRSDIIQRFQTVEDLREKYTWLPRTLSEVIKEQQYLDCEYFKHGHTYAWKSRLLDNRMIIHRHINNITACFEE